MARPRRVCKIAFTGHVDHGKSTLIGRLLLDTRSLAREQVREMEQLGRTMGREAELAFLVDQLQEERERLATYDTTQRRFRYRGREFVIIDTPGHVEFIRGMLTGATQANAAVLIIDVREGIQEQTRRHFSILSLIGIRDIIIVINKMDTVSYARTVFDRLSAKVRALCASVAIEPLAIVPASAREGDNIVTWSKKMAWYRGKPLAALFGELAGRPRPQYNRLRFAVQDVYECGGRPVYVGRVESGRLSNGQPVTGLPTGETFTVRRIITWPKQRGAIATAGQNIGVELDGAGTCRRGSILVDRRDTIALRTQARASVFWLADIPWRPNEPVSLRCATQHVEATLHTLGERVDTATLRVQSSQQMMLKQHEMGQVGMKFDPALVLEQLTTVPGLARFTLERGGRICGIGVIPEDCD